MNTWSRTKVGGSRYGPAWVWQDGHSLRWNLYVHGNYVADFPSRTEALAAGDRVVDGEPAP